MNTTNHRALGACCALAVALGSSAPPAAADGASRPTAQSAHLDDGSIEVAKNSPCASGCRWRPLEQDIATQTDAPGSIEAMPEKLVKITPPLAGRITRLQRSLGRQRQGGRPAVHPRFCRTQCRLRGRQQGPSALLQARQELERQKTLFEAEIAARKDYEAAQAAYDQAGSDAHASADKLAQYGASGRGSRGLRPALAHRRHRDRHGRRPGGYWNDINAPS
jgi:cobalt-zinc-cadmium efflux system membrane fusion protein